MHKKAVTLTEIIVALVILSLIMLGVTNLFLSGKRYYRHSRCRIQAGNLIKFHLENFTMAVRADEWQSGGYVSPNPLRTGQHTLPSEWVGLPSVEFIPRYNVTAIPNSEMRKVVFRINWTEPAFYR